MTEAQEGHEFQGKTVEDAIAQGLDVLGLSREDVDVEVISRGSRGIFGLRAEPARVRLTVRQPTAETAAAEGDVSETLFGVSEEERAGEEGAAALPPESVEQVAAEILQGLLDHMRVEGVVNAYWAEADEEGGSPPLMLNIEGKDLGVLIGRRGETLAALQYMVRVMVNQRLHRWVNIVVDVEGYKQRRAQSLRRLALRMAEQVARTGRPVVLEAMPAAERRLIHLALRDHPDVYTVSVGKEPRRKVTIRPKGT